jgi:hypothetical protein
MTIYFLSLRIVLISYLCIHIPALAIDKPSSAPAVVTKNSDATADLIKEMGLDLKIQSSLNDTDVIFKNMAKAKLTNPDKKFEQSLQKTEERFKKEKEKIAAEMALEIRKELSKRFSPAELKYLSDLGKYPLIKRFGDFLTSPQYTEIFAKPSSEIAKIRRQVKTELGIVEKPFGLQAK